MALVKSADYGSKAYFLRVYRRADTILECNVISYDVQQCQEIEVCCRFLTRMNYIFLTQIRITLNVLDTA